MFEPSGSVRGIIEQTRVPARRTLECTPVPYHRPPVPGDAIQRQALARVKMTRDRDLPCDSGAPSGTCPGEQTLGCSRGDTRGLPELGITRWSAPPTGPHRDGPPMRTGA